MTTAAPLRGSGATVDGARRDVIDIPGVALSDVRRSEITRPRQQRRGERVVERGGPGSTAGKSAER